MQVIYVFEIDHVSQHTMSTCLVCICGIPMTKTRETEKELTSDSMYGKLIGAVLHVRSKVCITKGKVHVR